MPVIIPMVITCEGCGVLDHVTVDGYSVGDRMLEGVTFEVRWTPAGRLIVNVAQKDEEYFRRLSRVKWLKAVKDFVKDTDTATCPKCNEDVEWTIPARRYLRKSDPRPFKLIDPMSIFSGKTPA